MHHYILDGQEPVPEPDVLRWARWFESADRVVAKTVVEGQEVSTVFLGLDHQWGIGPPLLFETMVFALGSSLDQRCERYATWADAVAGHDGIVGELRASIVR
jgi:hypothetical protein